MVAGYTVTVVLLRYYLKRFIWSLIPITLFFVLLELSLSTLVPEIPSWQSQGLMSIESYYAQSPTHFEQDTDTGLCKTSPQMTKGLSSTSVAMQPQEFPCVSTGQRIVTLGGSSIQGYGLPFTQTVASRLQEHLQTVAPNTDVINAGVAGYNSLQIKRMLPEVWALKPDILILYVGHNDYVFYPVIEQLLNDHPSHHLIRQVGGKLATWRALKALMMHLEWLPSPPAIPEPPIKPDFDHQAKAAFNQLTLPRTTTVESLTLLQTQQNLAEQTILHMIHHNIREIAEQARQNNCRLLLIAPVSRLDTPPVDGVIWRHLNQADLNLFWERWDILSENPPPFSDPQWQDALALAPHYAPLAHLYAQAAYRAGNIQTAIRYWTISQDFSPPTRSIRAGNKMADQIIQIGRTLNIPTIDPRLPFQQAAQLKGVPAGTLFLDSLHFTEKGSALITALSLEHLKKEAWILSPNSLH